jgi:hypothetical protein
VALAYVRQVIERATSENENDINVIATALAIDRLDDPIFGDAIEFYLISRYKGYLLVETSSYSMSGNSVTVQDYTLLPHYDSDNNLSFYTAARYNSNGSLLNDIEYLVKADALDDFREKIETYRAAANIFYIRGIPSEGDIAMASGDFINGLSNLWAQALTDPTYYIYAAHVFVGISTNLRSVHSATPLANNTNKIRFTSISGSRATVNIQIQNRTMADFKNLISNKLNKPWVDRLNSNNQPLQIIIDGNYKYVARDFATNAGLDKTISYFRNGVEIGKFRFNN